MFNLIGTGIGLLLMMAGMATAGYISGTRGTFGAVMFIIAGTVFILWSQTRHS